MIFTPGQIQMNGKGLIAELGFKRQNTREINRLRIQRAAMFKQVDGMTEAMLRIRKLPDNFFDD